MVSQSQGDSIDVNDPIPRFDRQWKEESLDAHDVAIENMMRVVDHLVKTRVGLPGCGARLLREGAKRRGGGVQRGSQEAHGALRRTKGLTFCSFLRTSGMSLIPVRGLSSCLSASETCKEEVKEADDDGYGDAIMDAD